MHRIRSATTDDAAAIAEIYKPYVEETAISFELLAPGVEEMRERIAKVSKEFPWLVYETNGVIEGYAYAGAWKNRCAYDWSVESTVYVKQGRHGQGIGKALYSDLLGRLERQGAINVIGGIALPNEGSVALHETLGFKPVAHFKDIGFKLGKWWDVGYWQLQFPKHEKPNPLAKPVV